MSPGPQNNLLIYWILQRFHITSCLQGLMTGSHLSLSFFFFLNTIPLTLSSLPVSASHCDPFPPLNFSVDLITLLA